MAEDKKRPVLKTSVKKADKYKETPAIGSTKARKTASEMNKQDAGTERSQKLGKGMAEGIARTMQSTTWAKVQDRAKKK